MPISAIGANIYTTESYCDTADRPTVSVDMGTYVGMAWTRLASEPADSSRVLLTQYQYIAAGWVQDEVRAYALRFL